MTDTTDGVARLRAIFGATPEGISEMKRARKLATTNACRARLRTKTKAQRVARRNNRRAT